MAIIKQTTQTVDLETGEVSEMEHIIVKKIKHDNFIMVFLEDLKGLFKVDTPSEMKLLAILWRESDHKEGKANQFIAIKSLKESWAKEIGITIQTIDNTITSLVKKELILKTDRSTYVLNPSFFFKGALAERPRVIRMIVEYRMNQYDHEGNENGRVNGVASPHE